MNRIQTALVAAALLAVTATGTTLPSSTTGELVLKATRICCARCESVEVRRDPKSGLIFTHVRLRPLEDLKGGGDSSTIELRIVGGEVDGVKTVVAGMPRFRPGRESILFLGKKNRAGYPVVVEARKGVLDLRADKRGRRMLRARVSGLEDLGRKRDVSLDDFRGAVRRVLEEERERRRAKRAARDTQGTQGTQGTRDTRDTRDTQDTQGKRGGR